MLRSYTRKLKTHMAPKTIFVSRILQMSCLIFDATGGNESDLIKLLFGNQDVKTCEGRRRVWNIQNKYYSAKVNIVVKTSLDSMKDESADTRAFIYSGNKIRTGDVEAVDKWHQTVLDGMDSQDDERIKLVVFQAVEVAEAADDLKAWAITKGRYGMKKGAFV